jgi:hypothetical protein
LQKLKNNIDSIHSNKEFINVTSLVKADLLLSDAYFLIGAHLNKGVFILTVYYYKPTLIN